jgi:hexosaminidase
MFAHIIAAIILTVASATTPTPTLLWPLPQSYQGSGTTRSVVPSEPFFKLTANVGNPTLSAAFKRYKQLTFPHITKSAPVANSLLSGLMVTVADLDESHPQLNTNETYTLSVPTSGNATCSSQTIYGAMHCLETFSQLVTFSFDDETYSITSTEIVDFPRFPHRGLMVDTARHFETLASLRHIIDSLPYAKINVLHWHMSDSQSFPFQVKSFPKLWDGAYSEVEKFTQDDVAATVEYARMRGVRVMVEFDVPGHAASWCAGYPEICPSTTCQQPLNVANNKTFDVIDGILGECTGRKTSTKGNPSGLFPDDFIHLGGDEVDTSCWIKTPAVNAWLESKNFTGDAAYAYFAKRAATIALKQGRRPVQWSEVYDHFKTALDKKTVVHIWKPNTNVTEVVANGYNVLINVGYVAKSWYLDNLNVNWTAVYANEPCEGVPDDLCADKILGGHGEMWGETVDTSDLAQTVWPRLAAIGERLWSERSATQSSANAHPRIEAFRCLLNRRGIEAAPVNNANARTSPPNPGSCLQQR